MWKVYKAPSQKGKKWGFYIMAYSENKKAYNMRYEKERLKRVPLKLQLEDYEHLKEHAEQMHESINGFIKRAINETIANDIKPPKGD